MRQQPSRPRPEDWPERLAALAEARQEQPFAWGTNDCAMFAADWVLAVRGVDPAEDLRGAYDDEAGAAEILAGHGGLGPLAEELMAAAGFEACPVAFAQRGDVVLVEQRGVVALGVLELGVVLLPGPAGLMSLPLSAAFAAWAV
jgi:hypothetical protein